MHDFQKFGRCALIKFPQPYSAARMWAEWFAWENLQNVGRRRPGPGNAAERPRDAWLGLGPGDQVDGRSSHSK
jgi:hypothetical protein